MNRKLHICAIGVNAVIAISTSIIATTGILFGAGDGQAGNYVIGTGYFKAYTMDSNIFTGVFALMVVIFGVRNLIVGKREYPKWLMTTYFMGTSCLLLTFLIAAAFLAPTRVLEGGCYFTLFSKDMFFFHFLNPILTIVSFTILFRQYRYRYVHSFIGMIPTVIYSFVYLMMVVVLKKWEDFYNFTFGGRYQFIPLVFVVVYLLAILLAFLVLYIHNNVVARWPIGDGVSGSRE